MIYLHFLIFNILEIYSCFCYNMRMENERTIVAIATPVGSGGVGIVRLSGSESLNIAKAMFDKDIKEPRYMYLGNITTENLNEKGFVVYFKAPHSYTGEDVVEFQVHGGILIVNEVLRKCISLGAVLAERGEFTKRAFLNNKVSLNEAESLMDYINAQSNAELIASQNAISGAFSSQIGSFMDKLKDCLAQINVTFDYPEHDDEYRTAQEIKQDIELLNKDIISLANTYNSGKMIKNGVNVCLVGAPNVGKSSILNALINADVAIVTDIAGTTTDALTESYVYNNVRFNIIDTAGLRESDNLIEQKGIERTLRNIDKADIVLCIFDVTNFDNVDEILHKTNGTKRLLVFNKSDLDFDENKIKQSAKNEDYVIISSKDSAQIEQLKSKIFNKTMDEHLDYNANIVLNERHYNLLKKASESLQRALDNMDLVTLDCIASDIMEAYNDLSQLLGYGDIEDILDTIFSKFCLGK